MKFGHCNQEEAITAAAHSGTLSPEQLLHAQACRVCETVLLIVTVLNAGEPMKDDSRLIDASLVWRRAQQRAREQALAKATLPIRVALAGTCLVATISLPWALSALENLFPTLASIKWMPAMDYGWLAALSGTTVLGITATLICIALSSWFVLREQ